MENQVDVYIKNIKDYNNNIIEYDYDWLTWYFNMHNELKKICDGKDFVKNCAIFSSQSINNSLVGNRKQFYEYIRYNKIQGLGKKKIEKILDCDGSVECILDILNGNKIKSFFINILQPDNKDYVTIDRHAAFLAKPELKYSITDKRYKEIGEAYKIVAKDLNILPNMLQAKLWCHYVENLKSKK